MGDEIIDGAFLVSAGVKSCNKKRNNLCGGGFIIDGEYKVNGGSSKVVEGYVVKGCGYFGFGYLYNGAVIKVGKNHLHNVKLLSNTEGSFVGNSFIYIMSRTDAFKILNHNHFVSIDFYAKHSNAGSVLNFAYGFSSPNHNANEASGARINVRDNKLYFAVNRTGHSHPYSVKVDIELNRYYSCAIVVYNGVVSFYLDSVLIGSSHYSGGNAPIDTSALIVGADFYGDNNHTGTHSRFFNGKIKNLKITTSV